MLHTLSCMHIIVYILRTVHSSKYVIVRKDRAHRLAKKNVSQLTFNKHTSCTRAANVFLHKCAERMFNGEHSAHMCRANGRKEQYIFHTSTTPDKHLTNTHTHTHTNVCNFYTIWVNYERRWNVHVCGTVCCCTKCVATNSIVNNQPRNIGI